MPVNKAAGVRRSHYKRKACFTAIVTCQVDKLNYGKKKKTTTLQSQGSLRSDRVSLPNVCS